MKTQLLKNPQHSYRGSPDHVCAYSIEKIIEAFDDKEDWEDLGRRLRDGAEQTMNNLFTPLKLLETGCSRFSMEAEFEPAKTHIKVTTDNDTLKVDVQVPVLVGTIKTKAKLAPAAPDSSNANPAPSGPGQ